MAAGSLSYEGISMQDNSRGHFGHNFSMVAALQSDWRCEADWVVTDSYEAQNLPGQTVNGTQNVYM